MFKMFIYVCRHMFICLKEVDISMVGMAMLVMSQVMIEEHQSCKSNVPLHMKEDINSVEMSPLKS